MGSLQILCAESADDTGTDDPLLFGIFLQPLADVGQNGALLIAQRLYVRSTAHIETLLGLQAGDDSLFSLDAQMDFIQLRGSGRSTLRVGEILRS